MERTRGKFAGSPGVLILVAFLFGPFDVVAQASYLGPAGQDKVAGDPMTPNQSAWVDRGYLELDAVFSAVSSGEMKDAKRRLYDAESIFQRAVDMSPNCREAAVGLGVVHFYKGYYLDKRHLQISIDWLTHVLEMDPYAAQAARYLANAYGQQGDGRSVVYYANYVESVSRDPELRREMLRLRETYQDAFLKNWNPYTDYYESKEARIREINPNTFKRETLFEVTPQYEQQMAAQGFQKLTESARLSQDAEVQAYVKRLVDMLATRSPGPPFTYQVDVIEDNGVNAFALPGRIAVNTGLIRFAQTEAELVAVLAHELGHVYAHHAGRQAKAAFIQRRAIGDVLSRVTIKEEWQQKMVALGVNASLELIRRGYSRRQETEADRLGTHIAFNAGYNPAYMTSFFTRLYEANPKKPFRLLATHPPTEDRIQYTATHLEIFPLGREMQIDSKEFQEIKKRLSGTP